MKITVIHDSSGTIRSAGFAPAKASRQAQLVADDNEGAAEIDTGTVKDVNDLRLLGDKKHTVRQSAAWRELTRKFQIDVKGNLLRK